MPRGMAGYHDLVHMEPSEVPEESVDLQDRAIMYELKELKQEIADLKGSFLHR